MKIKVNSLKMHQLFPEDTEYGIAIQKKEDEKIFENLSHSENLVDVISEDDIKYTQIIINLVNELKKIIPEEVLNILQLQININDYSQHEVFNQENSQYNFSLSNNFVCAYPTERLILMGSKYSTKNNDLDTQNMTQEEQITSIVHHELSHILDEINMELFPCIKKNNELDKLMDFFRNKANVDIYHNPNLFNSEKKIH